MVLATFRTRDDPSLLFSPTFANTGDQSFFLSLFSFFFLCVPGAPQQSLPCELLDPGQCAVSSSHQYLRERMIDTPSAPSVNVPLYRRPCVRQLCKRITDTPRAHYVNVHMCCVPQLCIMLFGVCETDDRYPRASSVRLARRSSLHGSEATLSHCCPS